MFDQFKKHNETKIQVKNDYQHPLLLTYLRLTKKLKKMADKGSLILDGSGPGWYRYFLKSNPKAYVQIHDCVSFRGDDCLVNVRITFYKCQ